MLACALVGMTLANLIMGDAFVSLTVTPQLALKVIAKHLLPFSDRIGTLSVTVDTVVWEQRFPRALGAICVGGLLAMAGVAFQSFLQNPLADPYTVGVSAGAALGSTLVILMGGVGLLAGFAQPLAAFCAGLLATIAVYLLARKDGRVSAQTFLLAGIVVGMFLWSFIPLMLSLASRAKNLDRQSEILSQLLGNLQYLGWNRIALLVLFGTLGGGYLWASARELNLMSFGEESAAHLGVNIEAFKRKVILAGALATAAAVSTSGIVAFVGLVTPHIARRLVGADHRRLLPTAMLCGGLVLVTADWLSRVYLGNLEIGVITSLLVAPVFCYLLRRRLTGH